MIEKIYQIFEKRFGKADIMVKSPGRVNLIGEHTDYNDGFVLPAAVDLATYFVCGHNNVDKYRFFSYNQNDYYETSVTDLQKSAKPWVNYLLGVIAQFVKTGAKVTGFDCVFGGNLPMGVGMSSSAALETGLAYAINQMESFGFTTFDLVKFSQTAEHEYADVQCGIMDQFAIMYGKKNQVIKLDCRSLNYEYYSFEKNDRLLVLVDTGVNHSLEDTKYNIRRQQCEAGVQLLQKYHPEIQALRDVSLPMLQEHLHIFDPVIYKRCRYVVEENIRVEKACKALSENEFITFGKLMYASHEGLKNQYEVSCPELDDLVKLAKKTDGVIGSRMMGGGFGGCTINVIKKSSYDHFEEIILKHYKTPKGLPPHIIKCNIEEGTRVVSL